MHARVWPLTVPVFLGEGCTLRFFGVAPHFLADDTVDTVGSHEKIAFELSSVGGDHFDTILKSLDRLDFRSSEDLVFVSEVFVESS